MPENASPKPAQKKAQTPKRLSKWSPITITTRLPYRKKAEDIQELLERVQAKSAEIETPPPATEIPVAMIADEFTYYSFSPEVKGFRLTPDNWRQVFEEHQPQLFFCESAWNGGNRSHAPWAGKIFASTKQPKENRSVLLEIIEYCHLHDIPTVYWNKEDPTHFPDRVYDFVRTSVLFDFVFTTAVECVPNYQQDVGLEFVEALPFAVQPKIFNPQNIAGATDSANFAGTWYNKYEERGRAASRIMDHVLDAGKELVIYDRMYGSGNEKYVYPDRYLPYTRPAIPYFEVANSYKRSKFGITLNTVTDSTTMFARRVFELAASGSIVLSNDAKGVREFFGDTVLYADQEENVLLDFSEQDRLEMQNAAMRRAFNHTYTDRAETILKSAGIAFESHFRAPALVVEVETRASIENLVLPAADSERFEKVVIVNSTGDLLEDEWGEVFATKEIIVFSPSEHEQQSTPLADLLPSAGAVWLKSSSSVPQDQDVRYLQAHQLHVGGPVGITPDMGSRYEYRPASEGTMTLIRGETNNDFLKDPKGVTAFMV